jgi:metal-responsive CopG/Arc/MetJ family transcriptional regulator
MNVRTNLMLPDDLVSEVDRLAGPRGRSRYVAEAIRSRLRRDRLREVVERTSGAWSAAEYPEFATPEAVAAWVRARRLERTDRESKA